MKLPHKTLERNLFKSGYRYVFGVDEVGVGCLAGPVVVCAVAVTKDFYKKSHPALRGLRESKLLSASQREKFAAELLKTEHLAFKICLVRPKTIDQLNIYQASRLAMRLAINKLTISEDLSFLRRTLRRRTAKERSSLIVLVDGKTKITGLDFDQRAIVKGDRNIFVIACASIIAKVHRDRMMALYAKKYPGYGFEKHKGYGTKYHQAQLMALGPCEIHRKSFAPVSKLL